MSLLSKFFNFILLISNKYKIDESHGIRHSMEVLQFASDIINSELLFNPQLKEQEKVIYASALLHDMCDKKYMDEKEGIKEIQAFLNDKLSSEEIDVTSTIISTMSYSKVKKNGFPKNLGDYELAYHIVREADLLSAYDFERCIIYNIHKLNGDFDGAFIDAKNLFENRVFKHNDDNLFITDYSKQISLNLHANALSKINNWSKLQMRI
jgi:HD superfamily phosphodiesterase